MIHELKCWMPFFQEILDNKKKFEIRWNDRDYRVGDTLWLREWNQEKQVYTGRSYGTKVSYLLEGGQFGLQPGYVCMSLGLTRKEILELKKNYPDE